MSKHKKKIVCSLVLSAFLHAGHAGAQEDVNVSSTTQSFNIAASCEQIILDPAKHITEDLMNIARERFADDPLMLNDEEALQSWILEQRHLFGSLVELPDLSAHPFAGRTREVRLKAVDGQPQATLSAPVECTFPQSGYNNTWSWELAEIRGDLAEASYDYPVRDFQRIFPDIAEDYSGIFTLYRQEVLAGQNISLMEEIQTLFSGAPDKDNTGRIIDKLTEAMNALEEEFKPASQDKMQEAEDRFRELMEQGFDPEEVRDFLEEAFEALEEFLKEQIEAAKEAGDEELQKQLEEMLEQLEEMKEAAQDMENPGAQEAWDAFEMMQEAQKMQQMMNSPNADPQQMMPNMQQMMQNMMNQMLDQKMMDELNELIEDQSKLLDDTQLSEEERRQRYDELRESLDEYSQGLKDRAEETQQSIEGEHDRLKEQLDAEVNERSESLSQQLQELLDRLQEQLPSPSSAQNEQNEGESGSDDPAEEDEAQNQQCGADIQSDIDRARQRLENPGSLNDATLRTIIRDMERNIRDLRRLCVPENQDQSGDPQTPNENLLDSLEEQLDALDTERRELQHQRSENQETLKDLMDDNRALERLNNNIEKLQERLQNPDMSEQELREAIEELGEMQSELMEYEEADMSAIHDMIMQFIYQLFERSDEVGAKEFIKEFNAAHDGNTQQARLHDGHQLEVRQLAWEMDDIRKDIQIRASTEAWMNEEEANAVIERLGEIQDRFDELDPPDENNPDQQQGQDGQQNQQGQDGQQQRPNELMQKLQEMMRRNQDQQNMQQDGQQNMQEMMEQFREHQQRQQQMREQLQQLREQLEERGLDPQQIDQIIEEMMNSEQNLPSGQGGDSSIPSQGNAIDGMRGLQQQLTPQPGFGSGPGPGTGMGGPEGYSTQPPNIEDVPTNRPSDVDPEALQQYLRDLQDGIYRELDRDEISPQGRDYLERLIP